MVNLNDNHLIKRLEEGKDTKVMLMSHNSYWSALEKYKTRYPNFEIYVFGSSTAYARMRKNDIPQDCDFILLDSSNYYRDNEFCETSKIAMKISEENNKRVSIGYRYFIPMEKRLNSNVICGIKIASFKNGNFEEKTISDLYCDVLALADMTINFHNELEKQKVRKRDVETH